MQNYFAIIILQNTNKRSIGTQGNSPKELKMKDVKHFHDTEIRCSAIVVDWATLNKLNNKSADFFEYLGNYFEDGTTNVYALFGDFPKRYCIKID